MSYGNWKHILGFFSFHNSVFNGISIIKTTYWVPLVLSCQLSLLSPTDHSFFFFFFFFFFLYLYFFREKSSYSPTTHTEKLIPTSKKLILTDILTRKAKRSSASIFDHTLKSFTMHSFSSSLLLYSFFDLVGVSKSASTTTADLCWKWLETIRFRSSFFDLEALLSTPGTIPLEGFYLGLVISRQVFFFFLVYGV